jgi:predicted nuclease of predicted toxin-antitoxin system
VKLLLDENLSPRLVELLTDLYPGSAHVHQCSLGSSDDAAIWEYAKANDYTVVSKDSDFEERSILLGSPPKVIILRMSNSSSEEVASLLRTAHPTVVRFISEDEETCLILRYRRRGN